ncbi:hypothetical protein SAMN02910368_01872 [Lachnospiraceae bacterium G11]|nr:hypothetical protein SAMN02910368_01872 [Lachnospiraceae bacterium G11]
MGKLGMSGLKKQIVVLLSLLMLLAGIYYIWVYQGIRYSYEDTDSPMDSLAMIPLTWEEPQIRMFAPDNHYLEGIKLMLLNPSEEKSGDIVVKLLDRDNTVLAQSNRELSEMELGEWEYFPLQSRLSLSDEYIISVEPSDNLNESLFVVTQSDDIAMGFRYAKEGSVYEKTIITILLMFFAGVAIWQAFSGFPILPSVKKIIGAFLILIQLVIYLPNVISKLGWINLDDSWRYFLNISGHEGYIFGKDVFFTYGPLGYLCYMMNLPDNGPWFIVGVAIWIVIIAIYIFLLWRGFALYLKGRISIISITSSTLCAVASFIVLERDNFLLYLLLLATTVYLIERRENEEHIYIYVICNALLTLMFFVKFSTFTSGFAFLILFVAYEWIVCKDRKPIWLLIPSLVAMPICYLIYNPSVTNLKDYVVGILKISSGWMETQQYDFTVMGKDLVALISIMVCYVILLVLALMTQHEKSGVIFACSASMFFVYKYATTRHGLACGIWLFGMIYSIIPLTIDFKALKENKGKIAAIAIPIIALCITITGAFQANTVHNSFGNIKETLKDKAYNWTHLGENGIEDTIYGDYMSVSETLLAEIGSGTVAVYPYKVSLKAAYPDLNVIHYPSVQNANEFIPWIDSKTAEWFADSEKASEYLLIKDETIDGHIKYLDAPLTWQSIVNNYSLVDYEGDWTLLRRKPVAAKEPIRTMISTETHPTKATINVPDKANYVVIHTNYSLVGKLKKLFYHVYILHMIIEYDDGTSVDGRVMTPDLESGFELCEYPQNTGELVGFLGDGSQKRIKNITLHGLGTKDLKDKIEIEWYTEQ